MRPDESNISELATAVEDAIRSERSEELDEIEVKPSESDANEGADIQLTGGYIPLRPALEAVARLDNWKVEHIGYVPDAEQLEYSCGEEHFVGGVSIFCAFVSEEPADLSELFARK